MLKQTGGRNLSGKISTYSRGQGHAQRYKFVNFNPLNKGLAIIKQFDYDSSRQVYLALICTQKGFLSYILATETMKLGDIVLSNIDLTYLKSYGIQVNKFSNIHILNPLNSFELGSFVCNFKNYARAAGTKGLIVKKYKNKTVIRLPSGKLCLISNILNVFQGQVAFAHYKFNNLIKAGQSRWLGRKSKVRGVAKNPVDHPHGGGEGKTSGGRCSVSPWGILTKGYPTVRGKKRKLKLLNQLSI